LENTPLSEKWVLMVPYVYMKNEALYVDVSRRERKPCRDACGASYTNIHFYVENWQSVAAGPRLTIRYIATTYDQEKWRSLSGARICKHLRSRGIDSKELIPPAWRDGMSKRVVIPARQGIDSLAPYKVYKFGLWTIQ
jgi:hypothetical protein